MRAYSRIAVAAIGPVLLILGFALNYMLERHNIFKVWEGSDVPISWADAFYPPLCVLLSLTGAVLCMGVFRRSSPWISVAFSAALALPVTVLYSVFFFGMQFVATGADRLGECPGLDQAARSSDVIPESSWMGHRYAAVGCGVERRGIFLSYYNDIGIYGVTNEDDQQRVLDEVTKQYRRARTHPVQVRFFEREHVSISEEKNGAVITKKERPSKLLRVVNIG